MDNINDFMFKFFSFGCVYVLFKLSLITCLLKKVKDENKFIQSLNIFKLLEFNPKIIIFDFFGT
tara:strand:- start:114 stop:305 length:192 start_codon:yes stop_codon:yes gene_type:complete